MDPMLFAWIGGVAVVVVIIIVVLLLVMRSAKKKKRKGIRAEQYANLYGSTPRKPRSERGAGATARKDAPLDDSWMDEVMSADYYPGGGEEPVRERPGRRKPAREERRGRVQRETRTTPARAGRGRNMPRDRKPKRRSPPVKKPARRRPPGRKAPESTESTGRISGYGDRTGEEEYESRTEKMDIERELDDYYEDIRDDDTDGESEMNYDEQGEGTRGDMSWGSDDDDEYDDDNADKDGEDKDDDEDEYDDRGGEDERGDIYGYDDDDDDWEM